MGGVNGDTGDDDAIGVYCPGGILAGGGFVKMARSGNCGEADGETGLEVVVLGGVKSGGGACWKDTRLEDLLSESSVGLLS